MVSLRILNPLSGLNPSGFGSQEDPPSRLSPIVSSERDGGHPSVRCYPRDLGVRTRSNLPMDRSKKERKRRRRRKTRLHSESRSRSNRCRYRFLCKSSYRQTQVRISFTGNQTPKPPVSPCPLHPARPISRSRLSRTPPSLNSLSLGLSQGGEGKEG